MSGHSKWHNIRVKKTAQDALRGKVYTKHAKLIQIVAQKGSDPATNVALRNAIDNAKADSVPNANIERAIAKGAGELKGQMMEEVMYACMAPGGAACLVECLTDNRNRTLGNVKSAMSKHGGTFTETSSVLWMFARKGIVIARVGATSDVAPTIENMELELIDFGAENIDFEEGTLTITTDMQNWTKIRDFLKSNGWQVEKAGLTYLPTQTAKLDDAGMEALSEFVGIIEEDEDVSEVFTNAV